MLGELANVPTNTLIDMVTIILVGEASLLWKVPSIGLLKQSITISTPLAGIIVNHYWEKQGNCF